MAQKKKSKKLNIRKLFILLLFLYLFVFSVYKTIKEPVRNIIIKGNYLVSDKEIINDAKLKNYPAFVTINTRKIKKRLLKNELISNVTIKKNIKFQIIIEVTEYKIICLDKVNEKLLLNNGESIKNNNEYEGIPILINYTPEDILKDFLKGMGALDYGTLSGISEIEYSPALSNDDKVVDDTRFLLKMNDGNLVYINLDKLNKLKYYQKIYASLKGNKGVLHLDSGEYLEVK